jgi:hypothetical protein
LLLCCCRMFTGLLAYLATSQPIAWAPCECGACSAAACSTRHTEQVITWLARSSLQIPSCQAGSTCSICTL